MLPVTLRIRVEAETGAFATGLLRNGINHLWGECRYSHEATGCVVSIQVFRNPCYHGSARQTRQLKPLAPQQTHSTFIVRYKFPNVVQSSGSHESGASASAGRFVSSTSIRLRLATP